MFLEQVNFVEELDRHLKGQRNSYPSSLADLGCLLHCARMHSGLEKYREMGDTLYLQFNRIEETSYFWTLSECAEAFDQELIDLWIKRYTKRSEIKFDSCWMHIAYGCFRLYIQTSESSYLQAAQKYHEMNKQDGEHLLNGSHY